MEQELSTAMQRLVERHKEVSRDPEIPLGWRKRYVERVEREIRMQFYREHLGVDTRTGPVTSEAINDMVRELWRSEATLSLDTGSGKGGAGAIREVAEGTGAGVCVG